VCVCVCLPPPPPTSNRQGTVVDDRFARTLTWVYNSNNNMYDMITL